MIVGFGIDVAAILTADDVDTLVDDELDILVVFVVDEEELVTFFGLDFGFFFLSSLSPFFFLSSPFLSDDFS